MSSNVTGKTVTDVVVIGGGLAGLSASMHLAKGGLNVVCLEPVPTGGRIVGESLDWSAPELFEQLGLTMEDLIAADAATYKRSVTLALPDGSATEYVPSDWLSKPPFNIELRTLHVDRVWLHSELQRKVAEAGVTMIEDRAMALDWEGQRIRAVIGASGARYEAGWVIDASGYASSFMGRRLGLPFVEYGPKKLGIWTYFPNKDQREGTTLFADCRPNEYLSWIWEIPISPAEVSVGLVTSAASFKQQRDDGSLQELFRKRLSKIERFREATESDDASAASVTSFSCRVYKRVCGLNWLIIGEAAAVPDPITGNGVTSALRHAAEAARLIFRFQRQGRISWLARADYSARVKAVCRFFDSLIEKLAYDSALRDRFGLLKTGDLYTTAAWSMNHLYSRFKPQGLLGTLLFSAALASFRVLAWIANRVCRLTPRALNLTPASDPY